jgi:hypothetical protein
MFSKTAFPLKVCLHFLYGAIFEIVSDHGGRGRMVCELLTCGAQQG